MLPYSIEELKRIISPIAEQHGVKSVSLFIQRVPQRLAVM